MKLEINENKYIFQPTQIIELDNAIVLKRGVNQIKISGELAVDVISAVATLASGEGASENELLTYFGADAEEIRDVLSQLIDKGFLVDKDRKAEQRTGADEYRLDIFFESMGVRKQDAENILDKRIAIIGVNTVSRQLVRSLNESNVTNYELIDNPIFRNISLFTESGTINEQQWGDDLKMPVSYDEWIAGLSDTGLDILICTSDFGGMQLMRNYNKFCVENNILFLPVILQDYKGYVGPLVLPGETACFECLLSRRNALLADYDVHRIIELSAYEGQNVIGFHPAMAAMLGNVAVMELTKYFSKAMQTWNVGYMIEINLLRTEMKSRKILKIPRCPVCSEMNSLSKISVSQSTFTPTNEEN